MWNLKKGYNELLCRTDMDSQILKNLCLPKETGWVGGNMLGICGGNVSKLGCGDDCTTIKIIKFTAFKKNVH